MPLVLTMHIVIVTCDRSPWVGNSAVQSFCVNLGRVSVTVGACFISLLGSVSDLHAQPSFNCQTDRAPDERTICSSSALSALDREMNDLYFVLRDSLDSVQQIMLRDEQRAWLAQRVACSTNAACISRLYQSRISQLRTRLAGPVQPLPQPPLQPAPTRPQTPGQDACDIYPLLCPPAR
jgi:uncharacterized protein YecT (DUF1311 family)